MNPPERTAIIFEEEVEEYFHKHATRNIQGIEGIKKETLSREDEVF